MDEWKKANKRLEWMSIHGSHKHPCILISGSQALTNQQQALEGEMYAHVGEENETNKIHIGDLMRT